MKRFMKIKFYIVFLSFILFPILANATEIQNSFNSALDTISLELSSPIAKVGLLSVVHRFYRTRVELQPNGYEANSSFQNSFYESFNELRRLLHSSDLKILNKNISKDDIKIMEKAFINNKEKYSSFVKRISKDIDFFKDITPETIQRSQMYFSIILSGFNRNKWIFARKFTHIWPFCE